MTETHKQRQPSSKPLTSREAKVVQLAAQGAVDKEIAQALGVQLSTVDGYWTRVRLKLGVTTRTEAAVAYMRDRLDQLVIENEALTTRITELEETSAHSTTRESEYRMILENLSEGVLRVDTFGNITYCNSQFSQMVGHEQGQLVGRSLLSLIDAESAAIIRRKLKLRRKGIASDYDLIVLLGNQRRRCLKFAGTPLHDEEGNYIGSVASIVKHDAKGRSGSALQKAVEESERNRRMLEILVSSLPIGIAVFDAKDELMTINAVMIDIIGAPSSVSVTIHDFTNLTCYQILPGEPQLPIKKMLSQVRKGSDKIHNLPIIVDALDGKKRKILASAIALHEKDESVYGILLAAVDITQFSVSETTHFLQQFDTRLTNLLQAAELMYQQIHSTSILNAMSINDPITPPR
jgi:PAS domain S-box-containing protein